MSDLNYIPAAEIDRALAATNEPAARTALFATLCRINTLYMIARAGSGHIGSSFSSLDIVSWLYLNELRRDAQGAPSDVFFSSKGHDAPGLYTVLISLGLLPFDKLHALRRIDGLPGHPDVSVPHIAANTGSLGMGISKAKGMIRADRLDGRERRIYVMTGDGELQEGQIWESLQGAANAGMGELTVIVDHNKIQSDHWVASTSDLGALEDRFASFGWHVQRCDGHDLDAFAGCLAAAKAAPAPSVIIADTLKGAGVSFMEPHDLGALEFYAFHSGAPSPENYAKANDELLARANAMLAQTGGEPLRPETQARAPAAAPGTVERLIPAYADALVAAGRRNPGLIALDADLVLDCGLIPFRETFADRYIECGIAEMDMVGQAGGLALSGKLPVVHSFACFLTPRANEQMFNNASERTKIIYVGSLAGLVPAGPGHSHQSVRDIALMSCIPGLTAFEPSSAAETAAALDWMVDHATGPCYLRLTSIPVALTYAPEDKPDLQPGRGTRLRDGTDAVLFAYGPVMLSEAVAAADMLANKDGLSVRVVNLPWLNRIDRDWFEAEIAGARHLFTIDNHLRAGGQGERIATLLSELALPNAPAITRFGPDDIPACGTNDEALRHHGLDRDNIAAAIRESLTV